MDIEYNEQLASAGQIQWSELYTIMREYDGDVPGLFDDIGAVGPLSPTGIESAELLRISFTATSEGRAQFSTDPADLFPRHYVLAYDNPQPVPLTAVHYPELSLDIVPPFNLANDEYEVDEDSSENVFYVFANDTLRSDSVITQVTAAANGQVAVTSDGRALVYTPDENYFGTEEFQYVVLNHQGEEHTANVTVRVLPLNDNPQAVDDEFTVFNDPSTSVVVDLLDNDTDPDNESLSTVFVSSGNRGGQLVKRDDGKFVYTPADEVYGDETFTYTVSDGNGGSDQGTIAFHVHKLWQNPMDKYDVDSDGSVAPIDVLLLIIIVDAGAARTLPTIPTENEADLPVYPDVNDDGVASAADIMEVIVELNRSVAQPESSNGEGEPIVAMTTVLLTDVSATEYATAVPIRRIEREYPTRVDAPRTVKAVFSEIGNTRDLRSGADGTSPAEGAWLPLTLDFESTVSDIVDEIAPVLA